MAKPSFNHSMRSDPWVYTTFERLTKSAIIGNRFFLISCLLLIGLLTPELNAQETYYVNSPRTDLNVRRGPGTEHDVITRLPHGTPVFVQDSSRLWLRIVIPARGIEGWVSRRFLANQPPGDPPTPGEFNRSEERKRFERLKRKGIIRVQRDKNRSLVRIRMSQLIWQRLSRRQQRNFLERTARYYSANVVELRDHRGVTRSRLSTSGPDAPRFESFNAAR